MKSLRASLIKPTPARGMSKLVALIILFPLTVIELALFIYMVAHGFRAMGEILFVGFLWNLGAIIALTVYVLNHRRAGEAGVDYKEISNYLNLNKIGRDKW